jgi:hypothetical protein
MGRGGNIVEKTEDRESNVIAHVAPFFRQTNLGKVPESGTSVVSALNPASVG